MSKKHKIAKKEAQAQKKLYEEEVLVENLENEKVKEVESGVIQTSDDSVSSSEENNEIVVEEEPEKAENVGVKNEGEDVSSKKSKDKNAKAKVEDKTDNKNKKDNKKKKDKKNKKGLIKKTKETASELKKVTWPGFGEVVKKTGIVIAFVVIFGLLIFGVDTLLGFLSSLLV